MRRLVFLLLVILMPLGLQTALGEAPDGMVLVPAGEFLMGSDEASADEAPMHRVYVSAFYIDRNEVTNAEFAAFVRESASFDTIEGPWFRYCSEGCLDLVDHYQQRYGGAVWQFDSQAIRATAEQRRRLVDGARWRAALAALDEMLPADSGFSIRGPTTEFASHPLIQRLTDEQGRLPVRGVTWKDASAFARWAGKRLPTEAEWEKAARGTDGRLYPWGSTWDATRCRTALEPQAGPAPVGSFPQGASPYGCHDMAGNVWEWVADWYDETYYATSQGAVDPVGSSGLADGQLPTASSEIDLLRTSRQGRESNTRKVLRGGGWSGRQGLARFYVRCAKRFWSNPMYWHPDVGFRCVTDLEKDKQ